MIDEQEMQTLVVRYLNGEDVKDQIIERHIPLARAIGHRYSKIRPESRDDLIAHALLALTQAVVWAKTRLKDEKITYYILCTIKSFLREFLRCDQPIRLSYWEVRRQLKENGSVEVPIVKSANKSWSEGTFEDYEKTSSDESTAEYKERIKKLRLSPLESKILSLRLEGYTLVEIAARLKKSKDTIQRSILSIQEKYRRE